ncbi:GntR family transcriptional regulator [Paenibacillus sabinae]|uniref:GntR family transcriptional regulator n=1 Tax=Paenibacillus sabinae T27 TaxID=1268072 RepID=X4ZP37_9BACL|nr:GntR family transcriptional regulator [Paenibacillus sabinae]AHV98937.1 GntR family transcriptional regulator [Paenibacillus sabinae T27]
MTSPNDFENFQFKKNDTVSLRQFVYQEIREAIIKGHLEPGARIREMEISKQMNVSRGPIREAIRILEQEGLVISHPYRETVVVDLSEEEVIHLLVPTRRNFELFAAQKAASVLTADDFAYLDNIILNMQEASDQDDLDRLSNLDLKFHERIVEQCVSPAMFRIWNSISGKLHARFLIQGYSHSSLQTVVEEHREMLQLIRSGDKERIEQHLQTHIK